MNTIQDLKLALTDKEFTALEKIVSFYRFDDNRCYDWPLSPTEKGVFGSLVKKGLIYDAFKDTDLDDESNFFPDDSILDIYGLQHY